MLERKFKSEKSIKRQSRKMIKHTQAICRQIADKLFECVWRFCGIGAKRVNLTEKWEGCTSVTFKFFLIIKNYK